MWAVCGGGRVYRKNAVMNPCVKPVMKKNRNTAMEHTSQAAQMPNPAKNPHRNASPASMREGGLYAVGARRLGTLAQDGALRLEAVLATFARSSRGSLMVSPLISILILMGQVEFGHAVKQFRPIPTLFTGDVVNPIAQLCVESKSHLNPLRLWSQRRTHSPFSLDGGHELHNGESFPINKNLLDYTFLASINHCVGPAVSLETVKRADENRMARSGQGWCIVKNRSNANVMRNEIVSVTRRPGENWNLWAVQLDGLKGLRPFRETCGFLVTDRGRCPTPIAYVPPQGGRKIKLGAPIKALAVAMLIRDGKGKPGQRGSVDLRGVDWYETHPALVGRTLIPLDAAGRYIGERGRWAAGYYISPIEALWMAGKQGGTTTVPSFCMTIREVAFPDEYEKSGSPESHAFPTSGIKRNAMQMAPTSA